MIYEASKCAKRRDAFCFLNVKKHLHPFKVKSYVYSGLVGYAEFTVPSPGCYIVHFICAGRMYSVRTVRHAVRLVRSVEKRVKGRKYWVCKVRVPVRIYFPNFPGWKCYIHVFRGVCID